MKRKHLFAVEMTNGFDSFERWVESPDVAPGAIPARQLERAARNKLWNSLSSDEQDAVVEIECVGIEDHPPEIAAARRAVFDQYQELAELTRIANEANEALARARDQFREAETPYRAVSGDNRWDLKLP
jgi:hypothetical protein